MVGVERPGGRRAGADRRHLGRRRAAARRGGGRHLLLRPPEVVRRGRRAVAGRDEPGGARARRGDRRLGPLDPRVPLARDGARELAQGPDLQHPGGGHPVAAGRAARLDERGRRAHGLLRRAHHRVLLAPLRLGRGVASTPRRSWPTPPSGRWWWARSTSTTRWTPPRWPPRCAPTASWTPSPTASSGATSCGSACSRPIEPADVRALTACIDYVVEAPVMTRVLVKEKIGDSGVELLREAGLDVELGADWEDGELERAHRRVRRHPHPLGHQAHGGPDRAGRQPQGGRPRRRGRGQRGRGRRHQARRGGGQRAAVQRGHGGRAHDGAAAGPGAQRAPGARVAGGGRLGALQVQRRGALREDARRARLRPHRAARGPARAAASACGCIAFDAYVAEERFREAGVERMASLRRAVRRGRLRDHPPAGHARRPATGSTPRRSRR